MNLTGDMLIIAFGDLLYLLWSNACALSENKFGKENEDTHTHTNCDALLRISFIFLFLCFGYHHVAYL